MSRATRTGRYRHPNAAGVGVLHSPAVPNTRTPRGENVTGLPYFGGKQLLAAWIAPQIPATKIYIEPFGGMASVLLHRQPVQMEIINDLDKDIINWWRIVRDHPEALAKELELTPYSREEYEAATATLADKETTDSTPLKRAVAVTVKLQQSRQSQLTTCGWARPTPSHLTRKEPWAKLPDKVRSLAARLREVILERCDAVELISRFAAEPEATIYVDSPYRGVEWYRHEVDHDALHDVLLDDTVQANIAVSDYDGNRPELDAAGWHKTTNNRYSPLSNRTNDVEALWTNYEPILQQPTLLGSEEQ